MYLIKHFYKPKKCYYFYPIVLKPFFSSTHTAHIVYDIYLGLLEEKLLLSGRTALGSYLYNTFNSHNFLDFSIL